MIERMLKMKLKKGFKFLVLLLVAALFAQNASAVYVPLVVGGYTFDETYTFAYMGINADVHCVVYQDDISGEYKYTYEVTNNSDVGISFFSVGIQDGANVTSAGFDTGSLDPEYWQTVGTPVQSVNAEFDVIGNGQTSSVLWFTSDFDPLYGPGYGTLIGYNSGIPSFAGGQVFTPSPIPEPATVVLLGIGGLAAFTGKRKRSV